MQGIDRSIGNGGQEYPPFRCSLDTAYYPNAFNLMALNDICVFQTWIRRLQRRHAHDSCLCLDNRLDYFD